MNAKVRWVLLGMVAGAVWAFTVRMRNDEKRARWNHRMKAAASHTALVTGASSGIGEAYAVALAEKGFHLVLVARREERLKEQAAVYRQRYGVQVEVLPADLSDDEGIARVERRIADGNDIDFLVNNAGYDVFGSFAEIPIEKTLGLINCLELACVRLTRAALPAMLVRRRGAVINVSSIGAFGPKPHDSTYVAAKAYLNQFSESLSIELQGSGVRVQALCPGFTLSGFHDAPEYAAYHIKERIPRWMWMRCEEVVLASLNSLARDQRICLPGWKNQLIAIGGRLGLAEMFLDVLRRFFPRQIRQRKPSVSFDPLICPECHGRLNVGGEKETGELSCAVCGQKYPVINGIPRFAGYESLNGLNRRFAGLYDWFSIFYRLFSKAAFAFIGTTEDQARFEILDKLDPRGSVLEVSIGPGVNLPYLFEYPAVREIYGLDISNGQLAQCQNYALNKGWVVHLYQGNAEKLPFQDETFDSVFHIGGINFFSDKQKAITEMIRVAKPGARIVICDETERGAQGYEKTLPGFKRSFQGRRDPVKPPVDLIPEGMLNVVLDERVWKGWFYTLEFCKPNGDQDTAQIVHP